MCPNQSPGRGQSAGSRAGVLEVDKYSMDPHDDKVRLLRSSSPVRGTTFWVTRR